jgi:hypothetical protein
LYFLDALSSYNRTATYQQSVAKQHLAKECKTRVYALADNRAPRRPREIAFLTPQLLAWSRSKRFYFSKHNSDAGVARKGFANPPVMSLWHNVVIVQEVHKFPARMFASKVSYYAWNTSGWLRVP